MPVAVPALPSTLYSSSESLLASLVLTVNGLLVGAGQELRIAEIRGLEDLPQYRTFDSPRTNADGMDFGTDLQSGRIIEVDCVGRPSDSATTLNDLRAALINQMGSLRVDGMPGLPSLLLAGRVRRRRLPTNRELASGVIRPSFDFECPDPRLFAAVETVLVASPGSAVGVGITPPLTPPLTTGGSAVGGHVQAVNEGIADTHPTFRVAGPVTAFSLLNSTTGRKLTYLQALAAGEWVDIDMDARTVLLNGTASRRAYMAGSWWSLPPGTSDVFYLPADAAVGSLMTLRFRSAY
jgi:hypothetical protein